MPESTPSPTPARDVKDGPGEDSDSRWTPAWIVMAVQALAIVVLAVWLLVDGLTGEQDTGRAIGGAVTVLVLGACAAGLAWGLRQHRSVVKTPTLVWDGLCVMTGIFVAQNGAPAVGVAVAVVAFAGFVTALRVPRFDL